MTDELEKNLWFQPTKIKKAELPEDRVEEALQKALDATTPDHPGTPWDKEEREERQRSGPEEYKISEACE